MGTIVRTPYVPGADVTAELQNTNENLVVDEFNGKIDNVNVRSTAGIEGIKLADAPSGIPTAKINDSAVTTAKISNDAVTADKLQDDAAVDANRAVTTNHIRDLAVTAAKLGAAALGHTKLNLSLGLIDFTAAFPNIGAETVAQIDLTTSAGTGYTNSLPLPDTTKYVLTAWFEYIQSPTHVTSVDAASLTVDIWKDTFTNKWYIKLYNPSPNQTVTGAELAALFIRFLVISP